MASAFFANEDPVSPLSAKTLKIGGYLSIALLLGACGFADLSVRNMNFDKSKARSKELAVLNIHYDDDEFTPPYALELVRVRGLHNQKGYAVRAPLYQEEEGAIHFTVSKQKEFKWFFGLQGRWEF